MSTKLMKILAYDLTIASLWCAQRFKLLNPTGWVTLNREQGVHFRKNGRLGLRVLQRPLPTARQRAAAK
jgi:hypothetical protein